MTNILLIVGSIVVPFIFWPGCDTREPKIIAALLFAMAISLFGIYRGEVGKCKNTPLLLLLGFMLIGAFIAPKPVITLLGLNVQNFWVWKSLFYIFTFFVMFLVVSGKQYTNDDIRLLFLVMVWVGFIMSIYCILQAFGIEQFFKDDKWNYGKQFYNEHRIAGTLGSPVVVSAFIAMIIPIALFLKKQWFAVVMVIAVCLTKSQMAIGAMVMSLVFVVACKSKRRFIVVAFTIMMLLIASYFNRGYIRSHIQDKGRIEVWKTIADDLRTPTGKNKDKYGLSGFSMGSFYYTFRLKHFDKFGSMAQAHNDYMELLYNTGFIGLILFLCAIGYVFRENFSFSDRYRIHLLGSFVCVAIIAGGLFVFQLAPTIFYTIIVVGLLSNKGGVT